MRSSSTADPLCHSTGARNSGLTPSHLQRRPPAVQNSALLRALFYGEAFFLDEVVQFARLEHFADDVAAADELALDVELGNRRPVGVGLDAVPQIGVVQHV